MKKRSNKTNTRERDVSDNRGKETANDKQLKKDRDKCVVNERESEIAITTFSEPVLVTSSAKLCNSF